MRGPMLDWLVKRDIKRHIHLLDSLVPGMAPGLAPTSDGMGKTSITWPMPTNDKFLLAATAQTSAN